MCRKRVRIQFAQATLLIGHHFGLLGKPSQILDIAIPHPGSAMGVKTQGDEEPRVALRQFEAGPARLEVEVGMSVYSPGPTDSYARPSQETALRSSLGRGHRLRPYNTGGPPQDGPSIDENRLSSHVARNV